MNKHVYSGLSFNNPVFKAVNDSMTLPDAESYCVNEGGHLVSIHSQEENEFVDGTVISFFWA